jgi:hypothetical protein
MRRVRSFGLFVTVFAVCAGCSLRMGDFTAIATQNVRTPSQELRPRVEGRDCVHWILFIPVGSLIPNIEEAVDRALEKVPEGNAMANVALYQDPFFTYIYNRSCIRVKGDVVKASEAR